MFGTFGIDDEKWIRSQTLLFLAGWRGPGEHKVGLATDREIESEHIIIEAKTTEGHAAYTAVAVNKEIVGAVRERDAAAFDACLRAALEGR